MSLEYSLLSRLFPFKVSVRLICFILHNRIHCLFEYLVVWLGKQTGDVRLKMTKRTDARVRMTNEIINGIQVIKMFAWEKLFVGILEKIRRFAMLSI